MKLQTAGDALAYLNSVAGEWCDVGTFFEHYGVSPDALNGVIDSCVNGMRLHPEVVLQLLVAGARLSHVGEPMPEMKSLGAPAISI